jgi:adenylate cyclase
MQVPGQAAVKEELERILSSKVFRKSTVLSNFLRYVVIETIEEKVDGIKEYTIAVRALGKPADFNPQTDAMIRIHAGRLRRALLEYYSQEGYSDPINISLNRGSYVPEFSFRETTSGTANEKHSVGNQHRILANRVAVLPFKNLSGSAENDFLVDGFCEQLSSDLAQFPEMEVIAYFSTSKFRDQRPDIRQVGTELNTSHLITGSLYRDEKRLRISMQLISAISGAQLWTQNYEHAVQSAHFYDIFDDIIKQVVPKLSGYYGIISRSSSFSTQLNPLVNQDSIDAVFWYYHYQIRYTEETFQIARERIERALQQNPDYALGWAVLAQLYIDGEALCYITVNNPLQEANKCIARALQLDNDCQHAYLSLTWMYIFLRDKNEAIKSIQKCISIHPRSPFFLAGACFLYGLLGEYEKSMQYFEETNILNPYYPWWVNLGPIFMQFYNQNDDAALEFASRINIPDVFWNDVFKISALGNLGRTEEAQIAADQFQEQFPGKAQAACAILHVVLFHEPVYERFKEGLIKAGLSV